MPLIALMLLFAPGARAQDADGYVALLDKAKASIASGDYKSARALLNQADAAAPASTTLILERDLARLPFYRGLIEWRDGDRDTAALEFWRAAITLSQEYAPEADVLPESDGQDVYYALMGEVKGREAIPLALPEDPGDTLIFVDGRRMEPFDAVIVGRHFVQLRCGEGNVVGSWYTYGAPPPDYLTLCTGGAYPAAKGGKAAKTKEPKGPSKAAQARAEKEAARKAAEEQALAEAEAAEAERKASEEKAAADKAAADKAAADKAAADKAAADKAAADKAAADKAAADKAAADKAAADKAAADKAAADKAAADKATADKAAADQATADRSTEPEPEEEPKASKKAAKNKKDDGSVLGWALLASGGAMLAGGGAINFLVVNPAWSDIEAANADPRSVTRDEADAIVGRFNTGRYATLGLLAAGLTTAGVGVVLGPLESHVVVLPGGVGLDARW